MKMIRVLLGLMLTAAAAAQTIFPLKASDNKRYLVDSAGTPFFVMGDTPWFLQKLPIEDVRRILDDRKAKGFNTLFLEILDDSVMPSRDAYGKVAFEPNTDITRPVEGYWRYADQVMEETVKQGFFIIMSDLWYGAGDGLWMHHVTPESAKIYGHFLGKRYAKFTNLMWMHCGDRNPDERLSQCARDLAAAIKAEAPGHLHTAHMAHEFASSAFFEKDPWLDVNMTYTYGASYLHVLPEYQRTNPIRPVILGETGYEGEDNAITLLPDANKGDLWNPYRIRRNEYWAVLSGAYGYCAGTRLWRFEPNWREVLNAESIRQAPLILRLLESKQWWRLKPDTKHQLITAGYGTWKRADYVTAARANDGSFAMAYLPSARTITVDLGQLAGPVTTRWFDPTSGQFKPVEGSPLKNVVPQTFDPPAKNAVGDCDWVLFLEAEGAKKTAIDEVRHNESITDAKGLQMVSLPVGSHPSASLRPSPGDVFREYSWKTEKYHVLGLNEKPVDLLADIDLVDATRAEIAMEIANQHMGFEGMAIRLNGNQWYPIHFPASSPQDPSPSLWFHHWYPTIPVALTDLKSGRGNTFEMKAPPECFDGKVHPNGNQPLVPWCPVYGVTVRVYYDPARKPHPAGKMLTPVAQSAIGLSAELTASAKSDIGEIRQIDFIGRYEDTSYEGDGVYHQWHDHLFHGQITHHLGSTTRPDAKVTWDTSWVPDQPGPMEIAARITDSTGMIYMTEAVGGLKLVRPGLSVELCKPFDVPRSFTGCQYGEWVIPGIRTEKFTIKGDLSRILDARYVIASWGGLKLCHGYKINDVLLEEKPAGDDWFYNLSTPPIRPLTVLKAGENTFSTVVGDGRVPDIYMPGVQILIQYRTGEASAVLAKPAEIPKHVWQTSGRDGRWVNGKYKLINNLWGTSDQDIAAGSGNTLWADSYKEWVVIPNYSADDQHVMAYPGLWRGFHYSEHSTPDSGFPVKLSEIRKLKARWAMREPMKGRHWALWDMYFAKEKSGWKDKGWCNFMVFQNWYDPTGWIPNGLVNPGTNLPVALGYHDAGGVKLKCVKTAAPWIEGPVITAVPDSPMPDATFDLKELFLNVAKTGAISTDWYLIGIEVGWEIHQGQEPMFTDYFEIDLNDENNLVTVTQHN
jgi:hypothetical protein